MSPKSLTTRSSRSADKDDSDVESLDREPSPVPAGKPGRKKNPNSQAARRDQNRIAQREFRLRKQQRIRDLEAKVELLSGNKDDTFNYMRTILRELMAENFALRGLIKSIGGFMGDSLPPFLPRLGWDLQEFQDFLGKGETDTALDAFAALKQKAQTTGKRVADTEVGSIRKRPRLYSGSTPLSTSPTLSNSVANGGTGRMGSADMFGSQQQDVASFSALFDLPFNPPPNPVLLPPPTQSSSLPFPSATGPQRDQFSGLPSIELRPSRHLNGLASMLEGGMNGGSSSSSGASQTIPDNTPAIMDARTQEAIKLIHYHLDNYKRNPSYHLPASLRPTLVQRTVPHDTVIDSIPMPDLRDRMILLKGRYDLTDCLFTWGCTSRVHSDDALSSNNWELHETWLKQYSFLVDQNILSSTNHWRVERGEPELTLSELGASEQLPATTMP